LAAARSEPSNMPTALEPEENQGGGLIGSGTVEGRAAQGGAEAVESIVDVLGRSAAGPWTSRADYLSVDRDVVLELYQQRVGREVVGARMRYVRPASIPTRAGAPPLDEMLAPRVV
jgi:hypothetical protein